MASPLGPKYLLSIQSIAFNPKNHKWIKFLPLGGLVPSGAYIARPLLSAWLHNHSQMRTFISPNMHALKIPASRGGRGLGLKLFLLKPNTLN